MKQRFLLALLFVCSFVVTTRAQIAKGSLWLGGNIGYNQRKANNSASYDSKTETFNISPAIGTAIKENLIAGIRLNYSNNTQKTSDPNSNQSYDKSITNGYGGGVFIRQYIPVISKLYIFGDLTASYNYYKQTETIIYNTIKSGQKGKGWDAGLNFTPGVSYGVTKKLQIESGFNSLFSAAYAKNKTTAGTNTNTTESFSAGINLENKSTFYIGFRLLINNKG